MIISFSCKVNKWLASFMRVILAHVLLGNRLKVVSGKPLYMGKGVRILLGKNAFCEIGSGVYLSPGCVIEVLDGGVLTIGDNVYMNDNCRVTAAKNVCIGSGSLFGPNVQIYDHDHEFDIGGCRSTLKSSPVFIGQNCWICANTVITRGCAVADRSLVSANSVVTRSLSNPGALYAGVPARLIKLFK